MKRIRGVIFDMDGVLIDAREWHYEALNQALALFGMNITREQHEGEYDGLPTREKLKRLSQRYLLPVSLHDFINEMKQRYTMQRVYQHCWPVFEHQYLLAQLARRGYRLAVASNSVRDSVEAMLERAQLLHWLQFTLSNEDVTQGKPNPEIYLKAMSRLNLQPEECVIVEDNPHGIAAAIASGAHVLKVRDPSEVTWSRVYAFISRCNEREVTE
ncbi:HAD family hydrolase [Enterobacter cloacae]|uniref:HAD family hydrolase n=1 Tax=Enterobacter cloacae TaxID=550 RepID=UPI00335CEBF9